MADEVVDAGVPGASARREYERRRRAREQRVRAAHPKVGGLVVAVTDDPQSTRAWQAGAVGEEKLGARLNSLASETVRLLHDRRIPGTRTNIDHLVVAPSGVYVVDAKRYNGRPRLVSSGGFLRPRVERLMVGTGNRSKLVDGVLKQVEVVRSVVDVPVRGVLCFIEADWPVVGGDFTTRGVHVLWQKKLVKQLRADGPMPVEAVADAHRMLAMAFPVA